MGAIGNINQTNTITVAGRVIDLNDPNVKVLFAVTAGAAGRYSTYKTESGGNYYQVPVGKTANVMAITYRTIETTGTTMGLWGYGDTAEVDSTTSPTNLTLAHDRAGSFDWVHRNDLQEKTESIANFDIPAGKYPCIFTNTGTHLLSFMYVIES